jgi:3-polyprenyl-4-hydroxybenzoate decarboxylase
MRNADPLRSAVLSPVPHHHGQLLRQAFPAHHHRVHVSVAVVNDPSSSCTGNAPEHSSSLPRIAGQLTLRIA